MNVMIQIKFRAVSLSFNKEEYRKFEIIILRIQREDRTTRQSLILYTSQQLTQDNV